MKLFCENKNLTLINNNNEPAVINLDSKKKKSNCKKTLNLNLLKKIKK